ncbi:MAG: Kdo hydroxylase family protein [Pseudomonadota bacterium]|nr:Kdo hydroxylase family protein [Pseudomonadota bacterium]
MAYGTLPENVIKTFDIQCWDEPIPETACEDALCALESGQALYFPHLDFALEPGETRFLDPGWADPKSKNISFSKTTRQLKGALGSMADQAELARMIERYSDSTKTLLRALFPHYGENLKLARTSFRPAEVSQRILSPRKDDSRLHVDSFPTSPTGGTRILRVFTNVNPNGQSRQWRLGEPFEQVAKQFLPHIHAPSPILASLMQKLGITRGYRTAYDHYMLHLHDSMKADEAYQVRAHQVSFSFPPHSSWIVYTDQVSHAAMAGQFAFEQTCHLPSTAQTSRAQTPLGILEQLLDRKLA